MYLHLPFSNYKPYSHIFFIDQNWPVLNLASPVQADTPQAETPPSW